MRVNIHFERGTTASGSNRVKRGGSWNNDGHTLRSAKRNNNTPGNRNNTLGFRAGSRSRGLTRLPMNRERVSALRPASRRRRNA